MRRVFFLFFLCLLLGLTGPEIRVSWAAVAPGEDRFRAGVLGPAVPDSGAQARLGRMIPGGGGLSSAMPPWGYRKPALREKVDEILALMDVNGPYFGEIVNIITQQDHYRIYQGTVFGGEGYEQALAHVSGDRIKARLAHVRTMLVKGERYYEQNDGEDEVLRVGNYWRAPGAQVGLWIELEDQPVIGHPVVVGVSWVTVEVIEAGLVNGRLKRPLP